MTHLHEKLASVVSAWRADGGHTCAEYPAVGEVLEWERESETATADQVREAPVLRNDAS